MRRTFKETFFLVKKSHGFRCNVLCKMRLLRKEDISLALSLHKKIAKDIGDENIFCAEHTIEESILGQGFVIGIFAEEVLIAMRAVSFGSKYVEEALADLRLPDKERNHIAVMDFCITEKAFRGNDIQHFTFLKAENLLYPYRYHLHTTISPLNNYSLRNMLRSGFLVVDLKEKYGGYLRFILHKDLQALPKVCIHEHIEVPIEDYDSQLALLSMGYYGYAIKKNHTGYSVLYGTRSSSTRHLGKSGEELVHLVQKKAKVLRRILPHDF
ncbi:MAG TPA: hypothetical protein DEP01_04410 [Aminobacterium sp.]|uniref:hypothetical protein n=1 Tax=Aminobacterium TaxID=81466 RepID=UPI000EEEF7F0|nr:hypothetical protein [Aminobacterium sp. UBA4834]HCA40799.1 hypothetical protein [Aminobacterium sp.]